MLHGLMMTLGLLSWATSAIAADRVVLKYSLLRQSVPVSELTALAYDGESSPRLRRYFERAGQDPDNVRQILTRETAVSATLLDRALNTPVGNLVLDKVGEAIYPPSQRASRQAMRAALVQSAVDDNKVQLIEVIEHYPTSSVIVDGDRLVEAYQNLSSLQDSIDDVRELLDRINIF